jgi:pSer/pThr/pTyr-binding forkhead associated (FHA) protein
MMPTASLVVEATRHAPLQGRTLTIAHTPFSLGRRGRDLNFDNDDNVSRDHAEITYVNDVFCITDRNSTHGTYVDERRIPANTPTPLRNGSRIRLGTTTVLRFSQSTDPELTNPELSRY